MELPSYAVRSTLPGRRLHGPSQLRLRAENGPPADKPKLGAPPLPPRPPGYGFGALVPAGTRPQSFEAQQAVATYRAVKGIVSVD